MIQENGGMAMKTRAFPVIATLCLVLSAGITGVFVAGGGGMTYTPPNAKPVVFSHEEHVNVKEL